MTRVGPNQQNVFPFRLFLLCFIPAALLVLVCAWYVGHDRILGEMDLIQNEEINNIVLGVRRLDGELKIPLQHLNALSTDKAIVQAISNNSNQQIETAFSSLATYNQMYDQIRWIDEHGIEQVRVNNVAGHPVAVPKARLQNKADTFYFKDSMRLKPGHVYISRLDLNVEHGRIEIPYKPVLRIATPISDAGGNSRGILIINVAASHMLDAFTESMGNKRDHVMMVNRDGYWLKAPNPADEWGFMFNRSETMAKRFPVAWKIISSRPADQVELDDGLWTWSSLSPLNLAENPDIEDIPQWLIISHLPAYQLALVHSNIWKPIIIVSLTVLAVIAFLTSWLAIAINGRNQAKVTAAKALVEAESAKALSKEQERYRMVVKANVNGLLVVDSDGMIVLTNPALDRMFGYNQDELLGKPLEILVPEAVHIKHRELRANFMSESIPRPMGIGRILTGRRKGGEQFPLEVSLSPFNEGDRHYVGAIVSDTSKSKQQ